jgi:hypothetical protein
MERALAAKWSKSAGSAARAQSPVRSGGPTKAQPPESQPSDARSPRDQDRAASLAVGKSSSMPAGALRAGNDSRGGIALPVGGSAGNDTAVAAAVFDEELREAERAGDINGQAARMRGADALRSMALNLRLPAKSTAASPATRGVSPPKAAGGIARSVSPPPRAAPLRHAYIVSVPSQPRSSTPVSAPSAPTPSGSAAGVVRVPEGQSGRPEPSVHSPALRRINLSLQAGGALPQVRSTRAVSRSAWWYARSSASRPFVNCVIPRPVASRRIHGEFRLTEVDSSAYPFSYYRLLQKRRSPTPFVRYLSTIRCLETVTVKVPV